MTNKMNLRPRAVRSFAPVDDVAPLYRQRVARMVADELRGDPGVRHARPVCLDGTWGVEVLRLPGRAC